MGQFSSLAIFRHLYHHSFIIMAPIYIRIPQFEVMSPREDLRFHLRKLNCGGRSGRSGRSQRKVAAATVASKAWLRDVAWLRGKAPFFVRQNIRRTSLPFQVFESFMYFQQAFWTGLEFSSCFELLLRSRFDTFRWSNYVELMKTVRPRHSRFSNAWTHWFHGCHWRCCPSIILWQG